MGFARIILCSFFMVMALVSNPGTARAQTITVDAVSTLEHSGTSHSWTHTVGSGSNRFLIVSMAIERDNDRVVSASYGGVAMTFLGTQADVNGATRVEVWGLVAPKTGANTVSISLDGTAAVIGAAISFANVDQTNPISASTFASGDNLATASASVASSTGELVLAALSADDHVDTVTAGSGQAARWNRLNVADVIGAGSTKPGSAITTMSYSLGSSQEWAMGLFSIQPVRLPDIQVTLISNIISDPVNGATNPKAMPGAAVRYCVTVSNSGDGIATQLVADSALPANLTYVSSSILSGSTCGTATVAEDDDASGTDENDPRGASFSGSTITLQSALLGPGEAFAIVFQALIN